MKLPIGSRDDFGVTVSNRLEVLESFRQIILLRGYKEISTPVVEYSQTFTNKFVDLKLHNMMKWFNPDGEIEVLRPDWTTAIARALAKQEKVEQKWAYQGSVFQRDKAGLENRQAGIELIHFPTLLGESECLFMAEKFLSQIGIESYLLEISHTGIFELLMEGLTISTELEEKLRKAMHDKRKDDVYQIVLPYSNEEIARELADLTDAFGSFEILDEYEKRWNQKQELKDIIHHLRQLAFLLAESGVKDIIFDLGRVKNLPYYSGILFRGFLKETGATCFSGGRYDQLYKQFEQSVSAVGVGFDIDILTENIQCQREKKKICIVATDETLIEAERLRNEYPNEIVDVTYKVENPQQYEKIIKLNK